MVAHVVLPLPLPQAFSYAVPTEAAGGIEPGQRVRVPFRGRLRVGIVVALVPGEAAGLEPIDGPVEPVPALPGPLLELTRWAAETTLSGWGEAAVRALPPGVRSDAPSVLPPIEQGTRRGRAVLHTGAGRGEAVEAAIAEARSAAHGVLVLAPEIELAREWAGRLARRDAGAVTLLTSAESPRRRWHTWWQAREGTIRVAVGTRVAAFLPMRVPGCVVVVDEEDPAHKAVDAPRWHARELAIRRIELEGGRCVLSSAAPSLESWVRSQTGNLVIDEQGVATWPAARAIDLRSADPELPLSAGLCEAIRVALGARQGVCLLLNRLGYGRVLVCAECGGVRRCPTCRLALGYHRQSRQLACRLCGRHRPAPSLCARCRGRQLRALGWGTERVEAAARAAFPGASIIRYDSTVGPAAEAAAREAFRAAPAPVLVGTQMALRLLVDRPVGLAALVLADATLSRPDFRAAERTVQLGWRLAEAVAPGGSFWIQTLHPEHPAVLALVSGRQTAFYESEWAERQELGYPPARRLAYLVTEGPDRTALVEDLARRSRDAGLTVLGPADLPGGRAQLAVLGDDGMLGALADVLAPLRGRRRFRAARLSVDVDPVELP